MVNDPQISRALEQAALLTGQMRLKESEKAKLSEKRAAKVRWLWEQKVPYTVIADAMGVTINAVYKILRDSGTPLRKRKS